MARADYQEQLERHAGEWDVLPLGLVVPSLPHGSDWREGSCRGIALLSEQVLEGNRWPAVSGALLAELVRRCATLAALTVVEADREPRPRELAVRFRKAVPVTDSRRRPRVGDGATVLYWDATVDRAGSELGVEVSLSRRPNEPPESHDPIVAVEGVVRFEGGPGRAGAGLGKAARRMSEYLLGLPRRLALPAYELGWSADEVRGVCRERPGSLIAVAEQALGDAGKIIRGDGTPADQEESMLLADMTYRWIEPVDDVCVSYVASPGQRRTDERGRDWVDATATLQADGKPVGEATGTLFFRRYSKRD